MTDESRVNELLEQWEARFNQGVEVSARELCQGCPELEGAAEQGIRNLKHANRLRDPSR